MSKLKSKYPNIEEYKIGDRVLILREVHCIYRWENGHNSHKYLELFNYDLPLQVFITGKTWLCEGTRINNHGEQNTFKCKKRIPVYTGKCTLTGRELKFRQSDIES